VFSVSLLRSLERNLLERLGRDAVLSPDEMSTNRYLELPDNSPSRGTASISRNVICIWNQRHKPTVYLLPSPEQGREHEIAYLFILVSQTTASPFPNACA
jgi:hypothetical protein